MNFPDLHLPTIVIVDDSDDDIFLLRHGLREGGIANPIVTFNTVSAAMNFLRFPAADLPAPGLVFTDIKMDLENGFDLLARIRDEPQLEALRVAVITASNHPADLERALELRADGYLVKFPPPHLLAEFVTSGPWFSVPRRANALLNALSA